MGFFTTSKGRAFGSVGKGKTRVSAWTNKDGTIKVKLGSGKKSKGSGRKSKKSGGLFSW